MSLSPDEVVLIGAGHTHVLALRRIARAARRHSARVTLICRESLTPYSGLLPGVIAGLVPRRELMLNIASLTRRCGIEYIQQNVISIDPQLRQVVLESGTRISYDHLSVNVGGSCEGMLTEGGGDVMPVKPVVPFLDWLDRWKDHKRLTCAVVGGGISGVEVSLAIDARLRKRGRKGGVYLVGKNTELIPQRPDLAHAASRLLERRGISQILGARAAAAYPGYLQLADRSEHVADLVIVSTGVRPWKGLRESGFECDEQGFVLVNSRLQSVSHPDVLACGDCATVVGGRYPKSGVFAVRQADTLAANVIAKMAAKPLKAWQSEARALAIICAGDHRALAHRQGGQVLYGRFVWWWKCYLDKLFMRKFQ